MLVEEVMERDVVTVSPTSTIEEALKLLQQQRVRHLPIIDENQQVIGIVSDRDVRDAISTFINPKNTNVGLNSEIQTIMSHPVITVHPLDFVEDIARIFYDEEFASLPVVSDNKLVGIVTEREMLYTLIQLTGTHVQSSHVEIKVLDRPGTLPEVTSIFGKRQININSLLIYPYKEDPNYKTLVLRFESMNPAPILKDIKNAGFELMWPNIDMENKQ